MIEAIVKVQSEPYTPSMASNYELLTSEETKDPVNHIINLLACLNNLDQLNGECVPYLAIYSKKLFSTLSPHMVADQQALANVSSSLFSTVYHEPMDRRIKCHLIDSFLILL